MIRRIITRILLFTALSGCAKADSRQIDQKYLPAVLPDALQKYAHLEVASEKNVTAVTDGLNPCLGLHLSPGQDMVHGGMRAEMSVDFPFVEGDTVQYAWQFMMPKDFISDAPRNRWWLIGQWHDQPNKNLGETWKDFPSSSPPVALEIAELNGRLGVTLVYGQTGTHQHQRRYGPFVLERGKWHSITARIHWSQGTDGNASVYLDGSTKATMVAEGPNMNNDFQHYLKLGMYRHPDIPTDNWIFINRVEIAKVKAP